MVTPPQTDSIPLNVFVSYSHRDEDLKDELVTHLANLKRQGKIRAWQDRAIEAGTEWDVEIKQRLEAANIILLLISPRFIASDYCYDLEMQRAIERHDNGTARVIPIILKPVDWQDTPFSKLQALPIAHGAGAKPITQWANQDEAFLNVVQGIRRAVEVLQAEKPTRLTHGKSAVAASSSPPLPSHNLTEKQVTLLKWIVEEVRAGKLDEEEVWISWTFDGPSIQGYQGEVPAIKGSTLHALENNNCIVCDRKDGSEYRFSLTRRAFEIAANSSE